MGGGEGQKRWEGAERERGAGRWEGQRERERAE